MGILPEEFGNSLFGMPSWLLQNPFGMYTANPDFGPGPGNPFQFSAPARTTPTAAAPPARVERASGSAAKQPPEVSPPLPSLLGGAQSTGLSGMFNNDSNAILGYLAGALQGGS